MEEEGWLRMGYSSISPKATIRTRTHVRVVALGWYPTPSPTSFWLGRPRVSPVIIGYPTPYLESFICLFLLFRVYVHGAAAGLHQSYHPHSFVKCCYMFCNIYLMFKGVDITFLNAHLMFLVVVFMYYWGCFMFSYLNASDFFWKYDLKWYLSYVVIKVE